MALAPIFGVLFDGFAYGMLLFLLSVGLSVTLGMMNFVNLAHCAFAMFGGYTTVTLMNVYGWPFLATLPLAFLAAAVVSVAFERDEIDVRVQHDRGALLNSSNQIARHRGRQTLRADEHMDPTGGPREEDRGLAGGIATPDDDDFFAAA